MVGFVAALVFVGFDFCHPEGDHPVGGEGQGKALPVHVHNIIYRQPPGDFLDVSFGKNNEVFLGKHRGSIAEPADSRNSQALLNMCVDKIERFFYYL